MLEILAASVAIVCSTQSCEPAPTAPAYVLPLPPCGTPEAKKEPGGQCTKWVVRRAPVQPADEWPSYEKRQDWTIDPGAPKNSGWPSWGGVVMTPSNIPALIPN